MIEYWFCVNIYALVHLRLSLSVFRLSLCKLADFVKWLIPIYIQALAALCPLLQLFAGVERFVPLL